MASLEEDFSLFEDKGESWVRDQLAAKRFGEDRERHARAWLGRQDAKRVTTMEAEQLETARRAVAEANRAANAAERAATAAEHQAGEARRANSRALFAIIIAGLAAAAAIVSAIAAVASSATP